jgi:hypothetical protein
MYGTNRPFQFKERLLFRVSGAVRKAIPEKVIRHPHLGFTTGISAA